MYKYLDVVLLAAIVLLFGSLFVDAKAAYIKGLSEQVIAVKPDKMVMEPMMCGNPKHMMGGCFALESGVLDLNLTEDQAAKLEKIESKGQSDYQNSNKKLYKLKKKFHKEVDKDNPKTSKLEKLKDEIGQIRSEIELNKLTSKEESIEILDSAQKAKLQQFMNDRPSMNKKLQKLSDKYYKASMKSSEKLQKLKMEFYDELFKEKSSESNLNKLKKLIIAESSKMKRGKLDLKESTVMSLTSEQKATRKKMMSNMSPKGGKKKGHMMSRGRGGGRHIMMSGCGMGAGGDHMMMSGGGMGAGGGPMMMSDCPMGAGGGPMMMHGGGMGAGGGHMMMSGGGMGARGYTHYDSDFESLNLTSEQDSKLEMLRSDRSTALKAAREKLQMLRKKFHAELEKENPNVAELANLKSSIVNESAKVTASNLTIHQQFISILDVAQKSKQREIMTARMARQSKMQTLRKSYMTEAKGNYEKLRALKMEFHNELFQEKVSQSDLATKKEAIANQVATLTKMRLTHHQAVSATMTPEDKAAHAKMRKQMMKKMYKR